MAQLVRVFYELSTRAASVRELQGGVGRQAAAATRPIGFEALIFGFESAVFDSVRRRDGHSYALRCIPQDDDEGVWGPATRADSGVDVRSKPLMTRVDVRFEVTPQRLVIVVDNHVYCVGGYVGIKHELNAKEGETPDRGAFFSELKRKVRTTQGQHQQPTPQPPSHPHSMNIGDRHRERGGICRPLAAPWLSALKNYLPAHAARADLCRQLQRTEDALTSLRQALDLAQQEPEQRYFREEIARLQSK